MSLNWATATSCERLRASPAATEVARRPHRRSSRSRSNNPPLSSSTTHSPSQQREKSWHSSCCSLPPLRRQPSDTPKSDACATVQFLYSVNRLVIMLYYCFRVFANFNHARMEHPIRSSLCDICDAHSLIPENLPTGQDFCVH